MLMYDHHIGKTVRLARICNHGEVSWFDKDAGEGGPICDSFSEGDMDIVKEMMMHPIPQPVWNNFKLKVWTLMNECLCAGIVNYFCFQSYNSICHNEIWSTTVLEACPNFGMYTRRVKEGTARKWLYSAVHLKTMKTWTIFNSLGLATLCHWHKLITDWFCIVVSDTGQLTQSFNCADTFIFPLFLFHPRFDRTRQSHVSTCSCDTHSSRHKLSYGIIPYRTI